MRSPLRSWVVFVLLALVAVVYSGFAADYIRASMRADEFGEYVDFTVDLVGRQGHSGGELRQLLNAKAGELSLPTQDLNIQIREDKGAIGVTVDYKVPMDIPLMSRFKYEREFRHSASFP